MKFPSLYRTALMAVLFVLAAACSRDPLTTSLPMNLKDIPKIQPELNKLSDEDRQLVLDYLKRSNGDVLPPNMADPDEPFTARTFAQAIKLQREYAAKQAVREEKVTKAKTQREEAFEPLRQALSIELVNREILSHDEASGRQPAPGQAINSAPILVTTFRVRNESREAITQAAASISVRLPSDPDTLLGFANCYFTISESLAAGASKDLRCANLNKRATDADKDYVAAPASSLLLRWEPKSITFESGKSLQSSQ